MSIETLYSEYRWVCRTVAAQEVNHGFGSIGATYWRGVATGLRNALEILSPHRFASLVTAEEVALAHRELRAESQRTQQ